MYTSEPSKKQGVDMTKRPKGAQLRTIVLGTNKSRSTGLRGRLTGTGTPPPPLYKLRQSPKLVRSLRLL